MLFNSYSFLFLFWPVMLGLYLWCAKRHGRELLWLLMLAGSLVFYGWNSVRYLPVLLGSMAVNYGIGYKLCGGTEEQQDGNRKKSLLAASLLIDILLLACFKYLDTGTYKPLSISFFTFTQIAFLMECYRGNLKRTGFLPYGIYVTWFPKMIQGPIALPGEILPELEKKASFVGWEKLYRCCYLFVLGLFKKVLIADTLGKAVDLGYESLGTLNSADAVIVMLAYTLQLYFDFSGYCDMAMGISGSFGLELPLNFDSPYRAANILEFWKGWHITLTRFFTKYLYIPLGGNRKGRWRTYWNCLLVFVISGLWHGEGINFLIWGLMHGGLYVLTRWLLDMRGTKERREGKLCHGVKVFLTFLYVNAAWVFFRASDPGEAISLFKIMLSGKGGRLNWNLAGCFNLDEFWYVIKVLHLDSWQYAHYILMLLILALLLLLIFFAPSAVNYTKKVKPGIGNGIVMAVLFVWSVLSLSGVSTFLYVNF